MEGKNVFITGVAGTGKSLVTQLIVKNAKAVKHEVAVAAPTGFAAVNLNLGAQTVHSLAGVKVPQRARDFGSIHSRANAKKWRNIEVLVIDEVGMLTADFLDWLDVNVREVRRKPLEPFGGIQLIIVRDFAQLGPIPGSISLKNKAYAPSEEGADCFLNIKECTAYAFQSAMWREAKFHHVNLKKVYRQSNQDFIQALMHLRESKAESHLVEKLVRNCASPFEDRPDLKIPEGIRPTVLYCTNWKVDKENCGKDYYMGKCPNERLDLTNQLSSLSDNLASLNTVAKRFEATDIVSVDSDVPVPVHEMVEGNLHKNKFFDQCQASKKLDLKVGAQVMLLQNLSAKLVNGSRGVIEAFKLCPMVRDSKGEEKLIGPDDQDKYPGRRFDELKVSSIFLIQFFIRNFLIFSFF
jgi:ATP-dependent DNA helicase PIF1